MRRLFTKVWPDTLFGQLLLALLAGLLAAQALTSTIWHDVRAHRALEVPTRVLATRVADLLVLREAVGASGAAIQALQTPDFHFEWVGPTAAPNQSSFTPLEADMRALMAELLSQRLAQPPVIRTFALQQSDASERQTERASSWMDHLLRSNRLPESRFSVEFVMASGEVLKIDAREEQGWRLTESWQVFLDYFVRIYLLRIVLLIAVVLWAVRSVTRPILRLARAAQALEQDLGSPPMRVIGPVEVRHAATAFNSMQSRLISQLEERTRFLAAVSHDLRSPITRLRLRTEMLTDAALKDRFKSDLEHMESMVAATLSFVESGSPGEPRRHIDLNSMLASMRQDALDLGHDVALLGRSARTLWGYPRSLKRCLDNLLDNALRYANQAELEIRDMPEHIAVFIRDDGPGIPAEHMARITDPFYRIEGSRNAETGGYGLGLSIARAVVESHAGSLTFTNLSAGGLEVCVLLPWSDGRRQH